jgi:hypothetical protein
MQRQEKWITAANTVVGLQEELQMEIGLRKENDKNAAQDVVSSEDGNNLDVLDRRLLAMNQKALIENGPVELQKKFFEASIQEKRLLMEWAEFTEQEMAMDYQLMELCYDTDSRIQEEARAARDVHIPTMEYSLEKLQWDEKLRDYLSAKNRLGKLFTIPLPLDWFFQGRPRIPKATRRERRRLQRLAKGDGRNDADGASGPGRTASPYTFTAPYFKEGAFTDENVVDEYYELTEEHRILIEEDGPEYGDLAPLEKLIFLECVRDIEDRWDIFFNRALLMGALNPERRRETELFLQTIGMSQDEYINRHKLTLDKIRDDAMRELIQQYEEERQDKSKTPLDGSGPRGGQVRQQKARWHPLRSLSQGFQKLLHRPAARD